jgi:hypothetical protein
MPPGRTGSPSISWPSTAPGSRDRRAGPEEPSTSPRIERHRSDEVADAHVPIGATKLRLGRSSARLHAEGYAVVAGAIAAPRRLRRALAPWVPGAGRVAGFAHPLLCPSVLRGVELERLPDVEGLPAFQPPAGEPWAYDASLVVTLG